MLETVLMSDGETEIDIAGLKKSARTVADQAKEEEDYDRLETELLKKHTVAKPEPEMLAEANPEAETKPGEKQAKESKDAKA